MEGYGIAAIEAEASGLPCILSDRFTKETLLTDYVSYLPLDSAMAWAQKIKEICSSNYFRDEVVRKKCNKDIIRAGYDDSEMKEYVLLLYGKCQ